MVLLHSLGFLGYSCELLYLYKIRMSVLLKTLTTCIRYLFVVIPICLSVFLAMLGLSPVHKNRERMSKQQNRKNQHDMWTMTLFIH